MSLPSSPEIKRVAAAIHEMVDVAVTRGSAGALQEKTDGLFILIALATFVGEHRAVVESWATDAENRAEIRRALDALTSGIDIETHDATDKARN